MEPKLTIIASAYNNPLTLMQMICNFKLQTCQNFQLIIVHDGLNEELREFIKPFLASNMSWMEVQGPNGRGNFAGRNTALDYVKTPYVAFASDDNYYVPKFIETVIPHLESYQNDMVIFRCIHNYFEYIFEKYNKHYLDIGGIDLCQYVIKTEMLLSVGKFTILEKEKQGLEDGFLCQKLAVKYPELKVICLSNCLLVHN